MKQLTLILCFLIFIFSVSCKENDIERSEDHPLSHLSGYWIPKQVQWGGDDPNSKDTGDVFRIAAFKTLCFESDNKFIYFVSTQRRPRDYNDSIIFAGEPAFNVFAGSWKNINDTLLQVDYVPIEYNINPPDKRERNGQVKILFQNDTLLLFENQLYQRTDKYDAISIQTIEGYKKEYLK
jgi:hypothetical protein